MAYGIPYLGIRIQGTGCEVSVWCTVDGVGHAIQEVGSRGRGPSLGDTGKVLWVDSLRFSEKVLGSSRF